MRAGGRGLRWWCATLAVATAAGREPASAQQRTPLPPAMTALLQPLGGLSDRQRTALARGEVGVRELPTTERSEVALLGVVAVAVPRDYFTRQAREARPLLASRVRAAWGTFGTPATVADVAGLGLDASEARGLRTCRPQHCGIKLPADVMARFRGAVDWSADPRPQVDGLMRRWLVAYVDDYRARGPAAMPVYDDTHPGERSAAGHEALVARDAPLFRDDPGIARHLTGPPDAPLPGASTTLYWSVDRRPGLAPILSVARLSTYVSPARPDVTLVVDEQLYASHYFDALLDVTLAVDAPGPAPAIYLATVRRARFDNVPGGGVFGLRGRVVGKLREALRASLLRTKRSLEAAAAPR